MSIIVRLYQGDKRANSTKHIGESDASIFLSLTGTLRDDTSVIHPVIAFRDTNLDLGSNHIYDCNLAYITAFSRRYFIDDWRWEAGLWVAYMSVDVLGTYRSAIGSSSHYVLRSSASFDGNIVDTLYPSRPAVGYAVNSADSPFSVQNYIIQYNGKNGVECDYITATNLKALCSALWNSWSNIEGMTDLYANVVDPFQYITGIQATWGGTGFWTTNSLRAVTLGSINTGVTARPMVGDGATAKSVTVPKHPQAGAHPYAKSSAYSQYSLKIPGCGWIDLSADDLYDASSLYIAFRAEPYTGNMLVEVFVTTGSGAGPCIASVNGKINTPWSIGATSVNLTGAASAVTGVIASALSGNFLGAAAGIGSAAGSLVPTHSSKGAASGGVEMFDPIELVLKYQNIVADNPSENGRPLMQTKRLDTIAGYIRCEGADFSAAATAEENRMVSEYLNGGFFYE